MTTSTTGLNAERSRRRRARRAGFTLLELVLVMLIICTILAMAAPSLRGFFASRQTADAAAQIVALSQLARSLAVTDGTTYRLNFDLEANCYWLSAQRQGAFVSLASEFGRTFLLPEGTVAQMEDPWDLSAMEHVEFGPDGRQQPATIRLTDRKGKVVEVTCPSPVEPFRVIEPD